MRIKAIIIIFLSALLFGCQADIPINEQHKAYIESFGWHVEKCERQKTEDGSFYKVKERAEPFKLAGVDLSKYVDKKIERTDYLLKEKHSEDSSISASIYEVDGQIIGGTIHLEGYVPGVSSIADMEDIPNLH